MANRIPALTALVAGQMLFVSVLAARADGGKSQQPASGDVQIILDLNLAQVPEGFAALFGGCENQKSAGVRPRWVVTVSGNIESGACRRNCGAGNSRNTVQQASWSASQARVTQASSCAAPQGNIVAELLKAYDEACAAGRNDEAERLARAALILNPKCFQSGR